MKNKAFLFIAVVMVAIVFGSAIISAAFVISRLPVDSVKRFDYMDVCHGAVVGIYLTMDTLWVTNYSRKITFLFTVQNISGYPNTTTFYHNSHVILNSVELDPLYISKSEMPFKKLSEKQGWNVDWYFTPKADDFVLSCMEISKGKHIQYSLFLEVNYTVVDLEGAEWHALFQNWATITIVGGDDAP